MTTGEPTESAVVVLVPEAEPVVGAHRARLDWSAERGVGAHVTVLYPWVPPARIDVDALERLHAAVAGMAGFDAELARTSWFGQDVLWLAPEPVDRFRSLVEAVAAAFPEHPRYEGRFADVVPHLTVADQGSYDDKLAAEREVRTGLPVRTRVAGLHVLAGSDQPASWRTVATVPLV